MALIPQAKCPRCDRRYSGLRTKCPYCGARRYTKSTRAVSEDNSLWKIIVGIVLLVVLIAAVVVLIVTGGGDSGNSTDGRGSGANSSGVVSKDDEKTKDDEDKKGESEGGEENGEGETGGDTTGGDTQTGGDTTTGGETQTGGDTQPTTDPTPTVRAQSVAISNAKGTKRIGVYNSSLGLYEFTMYVGNKQAMGYMVTPSGVESTAEWSVDNEERASILQDGTLTALKSGNVYVTVSIDGISDTVLVRIKNK